MFNRTLIALIGALIPSLAAAAPPPLARGLIVGGISVGGGVVGGIAGGAAGFGIGAATCGQSFECYGPLLGFGFGAATGVVVGAPLGGALGAKAVGARPGRTALFSLGGLGAGLALMATGAATGSWELQNVGLVTGAVGMPVMAGVAAATDRTADADRAVTMSLSPRLGRDTVGVQFTLAGF